MADQHRPGGRPGGSPSSRPPQRRPGGRPSGPQPRPGERQGQPNRGPHRQESPPQRAQQKPTARIELPVAVEMDEPDADGMMYIAYGEKGDDVAFELCDDIEEAFGVYQIMREDGFASKLYQAQEIVIEEE